MSIAKTTRLWRGTDRETNLTAWISLQRWIPWGYVIGAILLSRRAETVLGSSRKSNLVPTRITGTLGAWWEISGYH